MLIFFLGVLGTMVVLTGGIFLVSKQICLKELAVMLAVQLAVTGISAAIVYNSAISDTEVWNSRVVGKKKDWTSCEHSYSCNCRSCNCDSKGRCSRCCDTCHEHTNDWNWNVYTSTQETIRISRIDKRGSQEPPRWTAVYLGEPVSTPHSFDNYVKASSDSLFRKSGQTNKFIGLLPEYPLGVYDYYRLNRIVLVNGARIEGRDAWRKDIDELNAEIGASKQVNIVLVFARGLPPDYFYALEQAWIGGKKNDVIVVMGVSDKGWIEWANTMSWESNEIFKIKMRDALIDGPLDRSHAIQAIGDNIKMYHKRKPMAEFEYLKSAITPSVTEWVVTLIIGLLVSVGMSIFFHKNETFGYRDNFRF